MPLILRWKESTALPVAGEGLGPDAFATLSIGEVARLSLPVGNGSAEVGDLFAIEGETGDGRLALEGDLRSVRRIGREMASGELTIFGDVGPGLGQGMSGGIMRVHGLVGDSAGAGMRGGMIRIHGSAGNNLGGSLPGARSGMREGVILVDGNIGHDAGLAMRRGVIAVIGNAGDGLGRAMIAGSIFSFGSVGIGLGSGMKRGTLALFGDAMPRIGPTFAASGRDRPPFLTIYLRKLAEWGVPVPEVAFSGTMRRYNGDRAERGQGEILVRAGH
ncbi:MAG: formylmethanofuran dehydrogenase subunit [Planctomycetota bacterium]|nr:formylmethanofuran dehydrogenase subunit [Planctomycetota bacterium]